MPEARYRPEHCPTCHCEPVGEVPHDVPIDPYCPEHGTEPTAYPDCSCFRAATAPLHPHGASCAGSQNRETDEETR